MTWEQAEYLLKGIYLGLLVVVAMQGPTWRDLGVVAAYTVGGLALTLAVAAYHKIREGYRIAGRLPAFILFLLLENPGMVYLGIVTGLAIGARYAFPPSTNWYLLIPVGAGAVLGIVFWLIRHVRERQIRTYLGLALAVALIGGGYAALWWFDPLPPGELFMLGVILLLGIPGFYVLTFSSMFEESEVEIAAMCAALGIGLWIVSRDALPNIHMIALVVPLMLYYWYTRRVLPGLRVFKHTLRGLSYSQIGRNRQALASLGRALHLDPAYPLAREQLWELHRKLDLEQLKQEPEVLALVNYELCLERVAELLLGARPQPPHLQEAHRMLALVSGQRPDLEPRCRYWRAVAYTHEKNFEQAANNLEGLLRDPDSPARRTVDFAGWQLAIFLHPEMKRRVGDSLLAEPDRRMDAISAVERRLAERADDPEAWELKRLLYSDLSEAQYNAAAGAGMLGDFDHNYAQQLGLALLDDKERWRRGCEYLRIAARGLPVQAAGLYLRIAKAHEKNADNEGLWANYHKAMVAGRAAGVANLPEEDRKSLATVVKQLGDRAMKADELDAALEAFKFYTQFEQGELETWRTLAELFERKASVCEKNGDQAGYRDNVWLALHCTEHALSYSGSDKDLIARKDRYYVSIQPDDLKQRYEQVHKWFDVPYCISKTQWVLENYQGDLDLLDWAAHLAALARAAQPAALTPRVLLARIHRLKGEIPEATALLEDVRQNKPAKFASEEEEDAWFLAHRLLGDIYLDEKADQAVECFKEFLKSPRSGADTSYKLGRAYENLGDVARAAHYYEEVTTFTDHPLYYDARDGLERVRRGSPQRI
jgi:tetratricopeptide (TPR) repeat protein